MADQVEETSVPRESLIEKIKEKIHDDSSSSSDEETEKPKPSVSDPPPKPKIWRIFGRQEPVHKILGGGKPADVLLWKDKKLSAGILGTVTAIWIFFEVMGYHLLTFMCHALIVTLGILFLWSNASSFISKSSPPRIPEVNISEELMVNIALSIRYEINRGFRSLHEIATGHSLQKFLIVIGCFWVLSIVGSSCSFLTLVYVDFLMMFTIPYLYDKYEDKVDPLAEKATIELKKHYSVFDEKVLSKIPKGIGKDKKH